MKKNEENRVESEVTQIKSINSLEKLIRNLLQVVMTDSVYDNFKFTDSEIDDIVNQVIVDILFDKYIKEDAVSYRVDYARELYDILYLDTSEYDLVYDENKISSINNKIRNFIGNYRSSSDNKDDWHLEIIGDIDYKKSKQHNLLWDFCYVNCNMITAKQYKRTLTKKSGNNSYNEIIKEFEEYNHFTRKFSGDSLNADDRFKIIMRYYNIESYKRINYFLNLAIDICDLNSTSVEMARFFNDALRDCIDEFKNIDTREICDYIEKNFKPTPVRNINNNSMRIISGNEYYRPCQRLEEKILKKIIYSQKEILQYYSQSLIEKFLIDLQNYIRDNEEPILDNFLNDFLENHYSESERVIDKSDLSYFLGQIANIFALKDSINKDDIVWFYKKMFFEFLEELKEKYMKRLSIYQYTRSEIYKMFYFSSFEFTCNDYKQFNLFLEEKYKIYYLYNQNKFFWNPNFIEANRRGKVIKILKKFIEINENYSW